MIFARSRLILLLGWLTFTAACGNGLVPVPADLHGRWTTSDERYRAAWIQIDSGRIDFGTVEGTVEGYFVTGYAAEPSIEGEIHRIEYESADGATGRFEFLRNGDTIRMRSRAGVDWTRSGS